MSSTLATLGWREWVSLPAIGIRALRGKVDTGARTSALNAHSIETFEIEQSPWVRFKLRLNRKTKREVTCCAKIKDMRVVKDSGGHAEERYVIETPVRFGNSEEEWVIEITLANRTDMRFAMLIGRTAIKNRFTVDPSRSFVAGRRNKPRKVQGK